MLQQSTTYYRTVTDRTVSQLLLDYLKLEDVRYLFGIPGGGIMYLLERSAAARGRVHLHRLPARDRRRLHGGRTATASPAGLGVVLATTGPGAVNALTGVMNAQADHSAVLAITGEVAESYFGKGYLQQGVDGTLNVDAVYQASVQYSAMIASPDDFATLFTQALRDALSIPFRATHISLPVDVSNETPSQAGPVPERAGGTTAPCRRPATGPAPTRRWTCCWRRSGR